MTRYLRPLFAASLVLALAGCRFNANRPAVPTGSARPGTATGTSTPATLSDATGLPASPVPSAQPSGSTSTAIPVVARIERDLRHPPLDLAFGRDGVVWLLAADGIWQRAAGAAAWKADAALQTLELPATPTEPPAEIVTDPAGQPWILDPAAGKLWQRTGEAKWQVAATGLTGGSGLAVGADGTAYAVSPDLTPTVWRIKAGAVEPLRKDNWKHPVTTAVDAKGDLLVVDDGLRVVHRPSTGQLLAPIPPALGRLTIGRDTDGTQLIVGGLKAFTGIRIGEKSLSFPTFPTTSLPMARSESFTGLRLFSPVAGQYLALARIRTAAGTVGELRTVTVVGRKPGESYAPSTLYTGTALTVLRLAQQEADRLGAGYNLYRIRGSAKTSETTNRSSAWYFDYWSETDRTLATVTLASQGLTTERSHVPAGLTVPAPLGEIGIDSLQAWANAVKVGMPNHITGEMDLRRDGDRNYWRILWSSGGQVYRVDAASGDAVMETSQNTVGSGS